MLTLQQHFRRVGISPVVWRNLPPAFVYSCT
jgi:phospholipid N-methyltransferase